MRILIGSKNPGKIQGAKEAFEKYFDNFEIQGIPVSSDVAEEPVNHEIYEGARNRVDNLIQYARENGIESEFLTHEVISRIDLTRDAFIMALTQHINEVWKDEKC